MQNALKHLLGFGSVARYLGYASLKDFFPTMDIKPSASCVNPRCLEAQRLHQVGARARVCALREGAALRALARAPICSRPLWRRQFTQHACVK